MTATGTAVKPKGFDFVMFQAKDMAATRAFYENLFEITPGQFDDVP
jgi:predicted enzyme related to lactoylglutathione lyase